MRAGLLARLERLEFGTRPALTMRDAVDRPPQETREQWIARKAAEHRGEHYESGAVNSRGETLAQWERRRCAELGINLEGLT